jgi:DNA-directed RNA polymerase subunit K/omega
MGQYIQEMITSNYNGKYLLVNAIARRVRALQSGSKALVNRHTSNPIDLALEELKQGKIQIIDKGLSLIEELEAKPDKHASKS